MNCPNCGAKNIPMTRRGRPYCGKCNSLFPSLQDKYGCNNEYKTHFFTDTTQLLMFIGIIVIIIDICTRFFK